MGMKVATTTTTTMKRAVLVRGSVKAIQLLLARSAAENEKVLAANMGQ